MFKTIVTPSEMINASHREGDFKDDKSVPYETTFYHSRFIIWISIICGISTLVFGILLALTLVSDAEEISNNLFLFIFSMFLIIIGVSLICKEYIKLKKREPLLILNNRGIKTNKTSFYKWGEIEDEKFYFGRTWILRYKHPRGVEEIFQSELNVNAERIAKLMVLYRERSKFQK